MLTVFLCVLNTNNITTKPNHRPSTPAKLALVILTVAFLLFVGFYARADVLDWGFLNTADYTYDSSKINIGNGARLNNGTQTDASGDRNQFGGGTMDGVSWSEGNTVLTKTYANTSAATFTSRIFDAYLSVPWAYIDWATPRPYLELPDNSQSEAGFRYGNATMTNNLFLYHFNDLGSTSTVADTSGNATNLTCGLSGCPTDDTSGRFNSAARFNGSNAYLTAGNPAALQNLNALTVETWFKADRSSGDGFYQPIIEKWSTRSAMSADNFSFFNVTDITSTLQSYGGGIFDGRYLYYIPLFDKHAGSADYSSNFVRYDPRMAFDNQASYSYFDLLNVHPASAGLGSGVFDGRYIYMVGTNNNSAYVGVITRYDTTKTFNDASSYDTFDTTQITTTSRRLGNAMYDGRYVYFLAGSTLSGTVTRYDTAGSFTDPSSYSYFNLLTLDPNLKGGWGLAFDGQYMYILPSPLFSTKMVRYNTALSFADSQSYSTLDMTSVTSSATAFFPGAFDGRYLYFTPATYGTSSILMRYDTTGAFTSSSFNYFDTMAVDPNSNEFRGAFTDGHYMYYTPVINNIGHSGVVLRYDMSKPFTAASSYSTFDMTTVYSLYKGYNGSVFDGRYLYFPHDDVNHDGYMARYDLTPSDASFALRFGSVGSGAGTTLPGITGLLRTGNGTYMVNEWANSASGTWHHAAITYDGTTFKLFVDGVLKKSIDASGTVQNSTTPLLYGGFNNGSSTLFKGSLDESAIYGRALSENEVLDHYLRGALRLKLKIRGCTEPTCAGVSFVGANNSLVNYVSTTAVAAPTTTLRFTTTTARYFQYYLTFESDSSAYSPGVQSLSIYPAHYPGGVSTIYNTSGRSYQKINSLSILDTTSTLSTLGYQLSNDGNNWFYWDNISWVAATSTDSYNSATDVVNHVVSFGDARPGSQFYIRTIMSSLDGTETPVVSRIQLVYEPIPAYVGGGGGGGAIQIAPAPAPALQPAPQPTAPLAPASPAKALAPPKAPAVLSPRVSAAPVNPLKQSVANTQTLVKKYNYGVVNTGVQSLQEELKKLGFFPKKTKTTKYFGPITKKAVQAFLKTYGPKK